MLWTVNTIERVRRLTHKIMSPTRKLPLIVVTSSLVKGARNSPVVPIPAFRAVVEPFASVYWVTGGMVWDFNQRLQQTFGVHPSGIRIYLPEVSPQDDKTRHRFWSEKAYNTFYESEDDFFNDVRGMFKRYHRQAGNEIVSRTVAPSTERPRRPILHLKRAES